jgi:hypothetical protein
MSGLIKMQGVSTRREFYECVPILHEVFSGLERVKNDV